MEREQLREYLAKVMELEKDIYLTDAMIVGLQEEIKTKPVMKQVETPKLEPIKEVPEEPTFDRRYIKAISKPGVLQIGIAIAGALIIGIVFKNVILSILAAGLFYFAAACIPALMGTDEESVTYKSQMEIVERIEKRNLKKRLEYNTKVQQAEQEYKKACQRKPLIDGEINNQITVLRKSRLITMEALQKLYDLDIVYIKYRSIVPISRFCEYIESKIRDKLEGAEGMYDLYEQELRTNAIVGGLGEINRNIENMGKALFDISRQLTGVQQNQMLLYNAINESNEIARDIRTNTLQMLVQNAEMATSMKNMEETVAAMHTASQENTFKLHKNLDRMYQNAETVRKYSEYDLRKRYGIVPKDLI